MQQHVNGWELIDNDTLLYFKAMPDGIMLIDMTWLDTTRQDPEYGTGKEYVVCVSTEETEDLEEAEALFQDLHHTDGYCISEMVTKEDAEQIIMEYIETH